MSLLDTIEETLPCGPEGWKLVSKLHMNEGWPHTRLPANLKKKWNSLIKDAFRYKTGDPNITDVQARTREVRYKLLGHIRAKDPSVEGGQLGEILNGSNLPGDDKEDVSVSEPNQTPNIATTSSLSSSASATTARKKIKLDGAKPMVNQGSRSSHCGSTANSSVLESLAAAQIQHLKEQNDMILKVAALGAMAFMGGGQGGQESMQDTMKELVASILTKDKKNEEYKEKETKKKAATKRKARPVETIEVPDSGNDEDEDDNESSDSIDRYLDDEKHMRV